MKPNLLKLFLITVFAFLISFVLAEYVRGISHLVSIDYNNKVELMVVFGQLAFQFLFIWKLNREKQLNYLFNLMIVSLSGALLLLPFVIWKHFYNSSDFVTVIYFFLVVSFMFFDHKRRVKQLGLPWYLSYTWVLYRCIILLLII
jgi:hypothetical protein